MMYTIVPTESTQRHSANWWMDELKWNSKKFWNSPKKEKGTKPANKPEGLNRKQTMAELNPTISIKIKCQWTVHFNIRISECIKKQNLTIHCL